MMKNPQQRKKKEIFRPTFLCSPGNFAYTDDDNFIVRELWGGNQQREKFQREGTRMKAQKLGQAFALVLWVSACHMSGTCKTNEDCPLEGAFCFRGNHPKPGSSGICSMPSASGQPLDGNDDSQPPLLSAQLSHGTLAFSPMKIGSHNGSFATFNLEVSGFRNQTDAANVELNLDKPSWLSLGIQQGAFSEKEGTHTFAVELRYEGSTFIELPSTLRLSLGNIPEDYEYDNEPQSIHVVVGSGEKNNPIPVLQANIQAFNAYARTEDGLKLHYQLFEDIVLEAPLPPAKSHWVAIGKYISGSSESFAEAFTGSFDGGGHTLSGLVIDSTENDQGLFGCISGTNAEIKNIGLIGVSVKGNDCVGGLVGASHTGTVLGSYATGSVEGNEVVGGLVGVSNGTVQNSYATSSVKGNSSIGGLMGQNNIGTVYNSYATGNVKGSMRAGGLVGESSGTVLGNYATGSVSGVSYVSGLVGHNSGAVQNSYAAGSVKGNTWVGGLVGHNSGIVQNSYAAGSVEGSNWVGGLVGNNLSTVHNCVALNPSVTSSDGTGNNVGRVVGINDDSAPSMENNHARGNMSIFYGVDENGNGGTPKTIENDGEGGSSSADGQSTSEYNTQNFWTSTWSGDARWNFDTIWEWGSNNLPILQKVGGVQNHTAP
jgi:hypothetical protein